MAKATYNVADTAVNIGNLLGQKIYEQIAKENWDRLDPFAEYLVELHSAAMRHLPTGVLIPRDFKKRLDLHNARFNDLLRKTTLFSKSGGLLHGNLSGDFASTQAVASNLRNILGDAIITEVPSSEWDRLDDFAEYLVELHKHALNSRQSEFEVQEYKSHLNEYDARVKRFMQTQTLFTERESPVLLDIYGECRHVSPYYMMFYATKTTLLVIVLIEIFRAYAKDRYGVEQGTLELNLFGRCSEISPYSLLFYCANITLIFAVMTKIFYSFIKDYEDDEADMEVLGNQAALQPFVSKS